MLNFNPGKPSHSTRMLMGCATGIVTNIEDPQNEGRIKVMFPWLADQTESHWAPVVSMYAGPDRGSYIIPEVGDEVLVMFERGDISSPFIVGSVWNGKDKVPGPGNPDGENNNKWFQSRCGHKFIFDDTDGAEKITLVNNNGKLKFEIDVAADRITIEATTGDIYFDAPEGPIAIECKTMEITASNSTTTEVGNQLTETSKDRSETVGANCSATASNMFQVGTATLSVSFGSGSISAQSANTTVSGASTQTIGSIEQKGDAMIRETTGPETVLAGSAKFEAKQFELSVAAAATMMTGMHTFKSGVDTAVGSDGILTVMGGLINYSGGQAIKNEASLVTLS